MGNQQSNPNPIQRRTRYRTIDNSIFKNNSKVLSSRKNNSSFNNDDSIFVTPPINSYNKSRRSEQRVKLQSDQQDKQSYRGQQQQVRNKKDSRQYHSIDIEDSRIRGKSQRTKQRNQNDRILQALSNKNEQLRKQLKQISDQLTQKLKRKKLVPKRKVANNNNQQQQQEDKKAQKQQIGLKRQLQNAYKQIEMYKKILKQLKSKQQGTIAQHRLNILENQITMKNQQIQKYQQKKIALEKIRNKQGAQVKFDMNQDLKTGIDTYKKQIQQLQNKLKKMAKQDRIREQAYKKQQAYLCDIQKKYRQLDDSYFPQLSNHIKKDQLKTATSDSHHNLNQRQFNHVAEQARMLRKKHQEYNRKIQAMLQAKNKMIQQQNDYKDQIVYKERIIQALKNKIQTIQKLLKPRKRNLFGYDSQQGSQVAQSSVQDNQSQIERQLQQQLNQDQFDIKHLIANIPKPKRKRPQQITNGYGSSSDGGNSGENGGDQRRRIGSGGMVITSQKAQPKRWGAITTRTQQRGKHFKGQLSFQDRGQFDGDVQPLIVGVNIWLNKNNTILGIQAIYLNNNQLRYGFKSSDSADGIIKRFDLQTPDYLKNLTLSIGVDGFVQSIILYSKQGKIGKFGNKRAEDTNINFGLASNQRPFLFFGASTLFEAEPRLNSFGLQICSE